VRRPSAVALLALLTALLAGCGGGATTVPDVDAAQAPSHWTRARFPAAGLRVRVPANWSTKPASSPQVASVSSGRATVALWRYPRAESLPTGRTALDTARRALLAAVRRRDRTFRLARVSAKRLAGTPAIVVVGSETMNGQRMGVRSTHLFAHAGEVVVDAFAPPAQFRQLDRTVFRPLSRSVRIGRASGP
jgi:hypothetical protein